MAAEGHYYQGRIQVATQLYGEALAGAKAGLERWPGNPQLLWAVGRQQWNLGTTLLEAGRIAAALAVLKDARDGWIALAAADPQDEALASWQRTARLAYGEGLSQAGQHGPAIAELAASVAERRTALAAVPANVDRQLSLLTGLGALAAALGDGGRRAEACATLGEAADLAKRLNRVDGFSAQDRDRTLRIQAAIRARWCAV
jgi:tetratricopeptide (TPR) repeat protein